MFRLIKGSDGFSINKIGVVIDSDKQIKNTYTNKDGYKTVSIRVNNIWKTYTVQKLMGVAFFGLPINSIKFIMNHIDGNKLNNYYKNLEISTVLLNNIHAAVLNGTDENPKILVKKQNEVRLISNLQKASIEFGVSILEIWNCIKNRKLINGFELTHYAFGQKIPKQLHKRTFRKTGLKRSLKFIDTKTKEIKIFTSIKEAAEYFNVKSNHVHICITKNKIKLFMKRYIIINSNADETQYLDYTPGINTHGGCSIITVDLMNKTITIYPTAKNFIIDNELSKKAVYRILKQNKFEELGGFIFSYLTTENCNKLKEILQHISFNCPEINEINCKVER